MKQQITALLTRMASTTEGLSGVLWTAKYHVGDKQKLDKNIQTMQVQLDNLQADLNELKALEVSQ